MTDDDEQTEDIPDVVKVARDLTEIVNLADNLETQAIHKANDRLMPGGLATVDLAGVANLEAWGYQVDTAMRLAYLIGDEPTELDDEDGWEPPLQTLCFWSEQWRREHGNEYGLRPTIASEANYIRYLLAWAYDNELGWDDFVADINAARTRLENVLHAGRRTERTRVPCANATCERQPRLVKTYDKDASGDLDGYRCPFCKMRYTQSDYERAHARQLRSEKAERFVETADAIGTLRALGRPERTIRKWFTNCEVLAYCDPVTHEQLCWWPDLWTLHLTTATRVRNPPALSGA